MRGMREKVLERWIARYRLAWETNDPADIAALWTEDAAFYRRPDEEPVLGRDAIVDAWLEVADAPGETTFDYQVLGFGDGVGFVRGWTTYLTDPPSEFSNLWLIRLDRDGRAHEFTEWWMEKT
ncbi:nuclear transport factor 2 family protein [Kribbella sp. VKM Ac-2568]|uniref:YybH family protein n=1 Tax=Kribbella sp. VKM Ac-2568 TaxID=2512219 RepID=UPI0010D71602|nr:nuclear transport factor 2 family protein [Kribbella sp. VKM Ac-2568]TCM45940.1 SnoaL-like protein [Kribbella sp. VKM Ac-2568]